MFQRPTRIVPARVLRDLVTRMLTAAGCVRGQAAVAADGYVEADLRGNAIQGLDHLFLTLGRLKDGRIDGKARPRVVKDGPAFALVDGDGGLGHVGGVLAVEVATRKARQAGSCAVGLVNADDIFMLGYYADKLAKRGLVGFVFTHGAPLRVHPWGGLDKRLSTNPFAIGIPTDTSPVVLDIACSTSASGHIRIASYGGERIRPGLVVDTAGRPITDSKAALQGVLTPFGGAKGYGLALCVAFFAGPLIGARAGSAVLEAIERPGPLSGTRGHLFLAIDPAAFGPPEAFRAAAGAYVGAIKRSRRAPGAAEIVVPGERGARRRERGLKAGVPIYESVWRNTAKLAAELGVAMPGTPAAPVQPA